MKPPIPPPIRAKKLSQAPLSYSQESLWFIQQLDPKSCVYNLNYHYKFSGGVDRNAFEKGLNVLVERVEPFRTLYPNQEGIPIQVVQPYKSFSLPYADLSNLEESKKHQQLKDRIAALSNTPYDLQHGPVLRIALFHTSDREDHFFFGTHHIGFDGWSRSIMLAELQKLYDAFVRNSEPDLPELPIQYTDYALWQKEWLSGEVLASYLSHWKNILSGELPVLDLPTDKPRPVVQSYTGRRQEIDISDDTYTRIRSFCRKEELTPFRFFLAAYSILLMRYTAQKDLVIGVPFANRTDPILNGLQGFFTNTLPVRINLEGIKSVKELFIHIQTIMKDAKAWQSVPFSHLVAEISPDRNGGTPPIFQASINFKNVHNKLLQFDDDLVTELIPVSEVIAQVDISLELEDNSTNLGASFDFNKDLFREETIRRMATHYQNLLVGLLDDLERPISELDLLSPDEYQQIIFDWNNTGADFPQDCVQDMISRQVDRTPNEIAVITSNGSLTYRQLEEKANQLAHYLRKLGVTPGSRVGIFLPRTYKTIIALLAVLKAGGAYVPLELTYPEKTLEFIVNDSDPEIIITQAHLKNQLPNQSSTLLYDEDEYKISACDKSKPIPVTDNKALMYVIYTSGTTGLPKGPLNYQNGVVNYISHVKQSYQLNESDNLVQSLSLLFDGSVLEIFGILTCGGRFFFANDTEMRDPDFLYETIIQQQATWIKTVPTMLRALCKSGLAIKKRTNSIRLITPGGEVLHKSDVELARKVFGQTVRIFNEYGPTETSITSTIYPIPRILPDRSESIPIGKPIPNVRNYVLDEHLKPLPIGVKGELFIGGVGVGSGYLNRPELTSECFLPDPFVLGERMYRTGDIVRHLPDGNISFLGRADNQVKFRGYRVELGAIETALVNHSAVLEAVVKIYQDKFGEQRLVGYILPSPDNVLNKIELRDYLKEKFPIYMVPAPFIEVKAFNKTPNGKIDQKALPKPDLGDQAGLQYEAPNTLIEEKLARIWIDILAVPQVGLTDDFFDLGGHSLLAVQMISRIKKEFGVNMPIIAIFKHSMLGDLANQVNLLNAKFS